MFSNPDQEVVCRAKRGSVEAGIRLNVRVRRCFCIPIIRGPLIFYCMLEAVMRIEAGWEPVDSGVAGLVELEASDVSPEFERP